MRFTRLSSCITESSVWFLDDSARILWICMLAMADENGHVFGSVIGLAHRARITQAACEAALTKFMSADSQSRSQEQQGRRINKIDRGWALLNYRKYSETPCTTSTHPVRPEEQVDAPDPALVDTIHSRAKEINEQQSQDEFCEETFEEVSDNWNTIFIDENNSTSPDMSHVKQRDKTDYMQLFYFADDFYNIRCENQTDDACETIQFEDTDSTCTTISDDDHCFTGIDPITEPYLHEKETRCNSLKQDLTEFCPGIQFLSALSQCKETQHTTVDSVLIIAGVGESLREEEGSFAEAPALKTKDHTREVVKSRATCSADAYALQAPAYKSKEEKGSLPTGGKSSRLTEDFSVPVEWFQHPLLELGKYGFNQEAVELEALRFRDYWCAKPGKDGLKTNWQATWRNWCRNAATWAIKQQSKTFRQLDEQRDGAAARVRRGVLADYVQEVSIRAQAGDVGYKRPSLDEIMQEAIHRDNLARQSMPKERDGVEK